MPQLTSRKAIITLLTAALFLLLIKLMPTYAENSTKNITIPQRTYSVSTEIGSFALNAEGEGTLSYSSSDRSIATVSSTGIVTVRKNGIAYITVSDGDISETVKVRVAEHKAANGGFIEAIGNIDGVPGDSSGRELCEKKYPGYKKNDHSRSWGFIIRCSDPEIADKAALAVSYVAANDHFGYDTRRPDDQASVDKRASIYNAVVKVTGKNPSREKLKEITKINNSNNEDTSCTPTCLSGYWLYYDMSDKLSMKWIPPYDTKAYDYYCGTPNVEYHQLETCIEHVNSIYREKGMVEPFTIIYISEEERSSFFDKGNISKNLKRGDIICSCPDCKGAGHTGIMM